MPIEHDPLVGTGAPATVNDMDQPGQGRQTIQDDAGQLRQKPLLAQTQPDQGRPFQGPDRTGGPGRKRQWNRQGGKAKSQHPETLAQQGIPAYQAIRQHHVQQGHGHGAEGQFHRLRIQHRGLQAKGQQRRAEQQGAIDKTAP